MRCLAFPMLSFATIVAANPAFAGQPRPIQLQTNSTQASVSTSDQFYHDAVVLLRNGRKFNECVDKLRKATQQNPENVDYRIALGCALTSKAVALADAARQATIYPIKLADYNEACALWAAAQKKPDDPLYGQERPSPPPSPITKDDGKAFGLTKEQSEEAFGTLSKEAMQEWEAGLKAAQSNDQKAQVHFLTGWGKSILRVGRFKLDLSKDLQQAVAQQKCVDEMTTAANLIPNDASYWRGIGDQYIFDHYSGKGENDFKYNQDAVQAYRRSLLLNKKALALWYVIYLMESSHDLVQAEKALEQALRLDNGNSFLWYEKAYFLPHSLSDSLVNDLVKPSDGTVNINEGQRLQVLSAIEQGNAAGHYQFIGTSPQVPLLLSSAWRYCAKDATVPSYRLVGMSIYFMSFFSDNIAAAKKQRNIEQIKRWSQAQVGMGQTLASDVLSGSISPLSLSASSSVGVRCSDARMLIANGFDGLISTKSSTDNTVQAMQQEKIRQLALVDNWLKTYMEGHKSSLKRENWED